MKEMKAPGDNIIKIREIEVLQRSHILADHSGYFEDLNKYLDLIIRRFLAQEDSVVYRFEENVYLFSPRAPLRRLLSGHLVTLPQIPLRIISFPTYSRPCL